VSVVGITQEERLILNGDKSLASLRHIERGILWVKLLSEAVGVGGDENEGGGCDERQNAKRNEEGAGRHLSGRGGRGRGGGEDVEVDDGAQKNAWMHLKGGGIGRR
jgi:hypothetical protein